MTTQTIPPECKAPECFSAIPIEAVPTNPKPVTKYDLLPEGCYVARFKKINPQTPDEHVAGTLTFEVDIPKLNKSVDVNIPYYDDDDIGYSLNTQMIIWFDRLVSDEETREINWNEHVGKEAIVTIDHYECEWGLCELIEVFPPEYLPLQEYPR